MYEPAIHENILIYDLEKSLKTTVSKQPNYPKIRHKSGLHIWDTIIFVCFIVFCKNPKYYVIPAFSFWEKLWSSVEAEDTSYKCVVEMSFSHVFTDNSAKF